MPRKKKAGARRKKSKKPKAASAGIMQIAEDELEKKMLKKYGAIVVKFWDGKNKSRGLFLEDVAENHAGDVHFAKVAVSKRKTGRAFKIKTMPTFVMFKKGKEHARLEGKTFYDALDVWTEIHKE